MQAAAAAQTAAKSIVDLKNEDGDAESSKEKEAEGSADENESEDENDKRRKSALDKLEKASEDSVFGQASYLRTGFSCLCLFLDVMSIFAFPTNVTIFYMIILLHPHARHPFH